MRLPRLAVLITISTTACILSVQPVYTDADLVADPRLVGTWMTTDSETNSPSSATVTPDGPKGFTVVLTDDKHRVARYSAHLLRVGEMTLLDVAPSELPDTLQETYRTHFLPTHSVMLVEFDSALLVLHQLDAQAVKEYLEREPRAVPHLTLQNGDEIVLTAEPRDLQQFFRRHPDFLRHSGDPKPSVWKRVTPP